MLVLFSLNLGPAPSACFCLENGIQMHFFLSFFFFSPYLQGGELKDKYLSFLV